MSTDSLFLEVDCAQRRKDGEHICGDTFHSMKLTAEDRVIAALSDGLGSGVKASILSSMTATMALRFAAANRDLRRASEIIMDALPVCAVRRIRYATLTIIDAVLHGPTRLLEQGNPRAILLRGGEAVDFERTRVHVESALDRTIFMGTFRSEPEDRLIVYSDGVSQAGLGGGIWKLGWRPEGCAACARDLVCANPDISARDLAHTIVEEAVRKEPGACAKDDISCAVFYFRTPRRLLLVTGPAFDPTHDREVAERLEHFPGRRVVAGGTTANIIARELRREVTMDLAGPFGGLPPVSVMRGADLVTEGILTLTQTAQMLERGGPFGRDAAGRLAELLINSDRIDFLVGTRINEAHQDPTLPVDLEIRRNIIRRIADTLATRYLKETAVQFI